MGRIITLSLSLVLIFLLSSCDPNWRSQVIKEVTSVEIQRAHYESEGTRDSLMMMLDKDYVCIDHQGRKILRESSEVEGNEFKEEKPDIILSGLEIIPLRPQYAMSRGLHLVESFYYGELPKTDTIRFSSVWRKNRGAWKLVSTQYTPISEPIVVREENSNIVPQDLEKYVGSFVLNTRNPLEINISHRNSKLELFIPNHMEEGKELISVSEDEFYLKDENWEIEFISQDSISFHTWGHAIAGKRF